MKLLMQLKNLSKPYRALLILETDGPIDERDFSVPGEANAEISLLQTIFQPKTLLHDGATLTASNYGSGYNLAPSRQSTASRQLGTRHRAAMGIERVENCICVVVSEETGSISLAEGEH